MLVNIGSSLDPRQVEVSPNATLREVLSENGVSVGNDILTIDTRRMGDNDYDKTMSELGVVAGSFITVSQKMNSGK